MGPRLGSPQIMRPAARGFTLVELLIVIVILAVLAAIVLPKFVGATARSKAAAQARDLGLLQDAVLRFQADCGAYPSTLKDLAAAKAPAEGVDGNGTAKAIKASDWHGPYIQEVPKDPVSGGDYTISKTPPTVGTVSAPGSGQHTIEPLGG